MTIADAGPGVTAGNAINEHDQPSFPGGLSRRQIDRLRRLWMREVTLAGGYRFDRLDGFLTVCGFLPRAPGIEQMLPILLGMPPERAEPLVREHAASWLHLYAQHVRLRLELDLQRHGPAALPEFDFLPMDAQESDDEAELRTAKSWSDGACAALALAPEVAEQINVDPQMREWFSPIAVLGLERNDQGETISPKDRRQLMGAAAFGAHHLWRRLVGA